MTCPSCGFENIDNARYCGRCRMGFTKRELLVVRLRDHLFWIFRRANAGFLAGLVAWFFIPALSRVISSDATATLYFALEGLLGGAILGSVDGMVDESTPKTMLGSLIGGACGAAAGAIFGHYSEGLSAPQTVGGLFAFWAFAGAGIGIVSALWERRPKKLFFGALFGLLGGGFGGSLRYAVYAYLIDTFNPQSWMVRRGMEGFSGGILGVTLWFLIAVAERFVIFTRKRLEPNKTHKTCHHCNAHAPMNHWYCMVCGSVLQEAAPPAALHLPKFGTLHRFSGFLHFMSRLSATAGAIAGAVVFIVLFPVNHMLAFVAAVLVAIMSYAFQGAFSAVSETIRILIGK
ncbi:MAG: zinc ribbon domain-containing protein [Elusimicrobia bacterium]|nr:zinc ribbon domain-containing protein [Elusimicrobiota bacterium]